MGFKAAHHGPFVTPAQHSPPLRNLETQVFQSYNLADEGDGCIHKCMSSRIFNVAKAAINK